MAQFPCRRTDVSLMMPSTASHSSITRSGKEALGDASFGVTSNVVVFYCLNKAKFGLDSQ